MQTFCVDCLPQKNCVIVHAMNIHGSFIYMHVRAWILLRIHVLPACLRVAAVHRSISLALPRLASPCEGGRAFVLN